MKNVSVKNYLGSNIFEITFKLKLGLHSKKNWSPILIRAMKTPKVVIFAQHLLLANFIV